MGGTGRKATVIGASFWSVLAGLLLLLPLLVSGPARAAVSLPDGRAWEMVSPLEKNGGEINGINGTAPNEGLPEGGIVQASPDGGLVTYLSLLAFPGVKGEEHEEPQGAPLASQYLSTREAGQWSTENLTAALNSKTYPAAGNGAPYKAFSSNLSLGLMLNGSPAPVENSPLGGAPEGYLNYYIHGRNGSIYEPLLTTPPAEGPSEFFMELLGVTPDLGHIVVATRAALPPVTTKRAAGNLYEWSNGKFQPINILPGVPGLTETTSAGALLGTEHSESHTISDDGSRVFWGTESSSSLFVRENIGTAQATTVQIDAAQEGSNGPGGRGEFWTASVNGSRAFFTDRNRLTPGSTAGGDASHEDLYMFDIETERLTDLTVDGSGQGAEVQGVVEASEDGSYIYFVAHGSLPNTNAVAGNDNLYMWHEGVIRFIAALSSNDSEHAGNYEPIVAHDWEQTAGLRSARVEVGGERLVFMSGASLTGYDNHDANLQSRLDEEVYLYDAGSNNLTCVSCNPSGQRPAGSSGIPGGTVWRTGSELGTYQSRVLSTDGSRVFFDSKDALVPQDSNGAQDVYEWEQNGHGTCGHEGGCTYLLSGAASVSDSSFVDASASGDDVFVVTRAQLVGQDTDQLRDLYDARVGGGFPPLPSSTPRCEGESCLPTASLPPMLGSVASLAFSGMGNTPPVPTKSRVKAKVKRRSKARRGKGHAKKAVRRAHAGDAHRGRKKA